jgi:predicted nucleotidyltransferase
MLTANHILQQIHNLKPLLETRFKVKEIALFGSYARNEQHEESDIDLMVLLQEPSYVNLCGTRYLLQSVFPEKNIQVVSKKGIKPPYFEAIKNDLIYA